MHALLSDGPLEGRTIGVDTNEHGEPPHTIDVDELDGHVYFYDLVSMAEEARRPSTGFATSRRSDLVR
jgi:hypothetical protein